MMMALWQLEKLCCL